MSEYSNFPLIYSHTCLPSYASTESHSLIDATTVSSSLPPPTYTASIPSHAHARSNASEVPLLQPDPYSEVPLHPNNLPISPPTRMSPAQCRQTMTRLDVNRILTYEEFISGVVSGRFKFDGAEGLDLDRHKPLGRLGWSLGGAAQDASMACFEGDQHPPAIILRDVLI